MSGIVLGQYYFTTSREKIYIDATQKPSKVNEFRHLTDSSKASRDDIRYILMKYMVICLWNVLTFSSLRELRFIPVACILPLRQQQIYLFWHTTEPIDALFPSAVVPIITDRIIFPEKLIPLMITDALNDRALPLYGEGLNVHDWLCVEDHCKAIDFIIHNDRVGEIYNGGGHNEKQNIEIV